MRIEEAQRIAGIAKELFADKAATVLNIGSSTRHFREVSQPHIEAELLQPLMSAGFSLLHCDMKSDDGVDLVGNVLEASFRDEIADLDVDLLLCCNILEHLADPKIFASACADIVRPGGYIIVSVPYSYPHHADPIDNGLRPNPDELAAMFQNLDVVKKEIVVSTTYLQDSLRVAGGEKQLLQNLIKLIVPFTGVKRWRSRAHRFLWLWRPYRVSLVVLSKPADS